MSDRGQKAIQAVLDSPQEYGLPVGYAKLSEAKQRDARMKVFRGWYDPNNPAELCTDENKFLQAARLFCDWILKPAERNSSVYHLDDPLHKFDMMKMAVLAPKRATEPSKVAFHAPRFSGKTQTVVHDMGTFIAVTRPDTYVLFCGVNAKRTSEPMEAIRWEIEDNDRIHADFGGKGELFPKSRYGGRKWNESSLQLLNGSLLRGYPFKAGQRGRHPILVIFDDVEDENLIARKGWLEQATTLVFRTYMGMLSRGSHIILMGTNNGPGSMLGHVLTQHDESEVVERDKRFDDWHTFKFEQVTTLEDGTRSSLWEGRMSVEGYDVASESRGEDAVLSEYQGQTTAGMVRVFGVHELMHGYMKATVVGGDQEFMVDLATGIAVPWQEWLDTLAVTAAIDFADSTTRFSSDGAIVLIGVDPDGVLFVLDAFIGKKHIDELIDLALDMSVEWKARRLGCENFGLQGAFIRQARQKATLMAETGRMAPNVVESPNNRQRKGTRIQATVAPFVKHRKIRFPRRLEIVSKVDGKQYGAVAGVPTMGCTRLWRQIEQFTDQSERGVDGADALHMAIRTSGCRVGITPEHFHFNEPQIVAWRDAGFEVNRWSLDQRGWTPKMWREHNEEMDAKVGAVLGGEESWEASIYD